MAVYVVYNDALISFMNCTFECWIFFPQNEKLKMSGNQSYGIAFKIMSYIVGMKMASANCTIFANKFNEFRVHKFRFIVRAYLWAPYWIHFIWPRTIENHNNKKREKYLWNIWNYEWWQMPVINVRNHTWHFHHRHHNKMQQTSHPTVRIIEWSFHSGRLCYSSFSDFLFVSTFHWTKRPVKHFNEYYLCSVCDVVRCDTVPVPSSLFRNQNMKWGPIRRPFSQKWISMMLTMMTHMCMCVCDARTTIDKIEFVQMGSGEWERSNTKPWKLTRLFEYFWFAISFLLLIM